MKLKIFCYMFLFISESFCGTKNSNNETKAVIKLLTHWYEKNDNDNYIENVKNGLNSILQLKSPDCEDQIKKMDIDEKTVFYQGVCKLAIFANDNSLEELKDKTDQIDQIILNMGAEFGLSSEKDFDEAIKNLSKKKKRRKKLQNMEKKSKIKLII